MRGSSLLHASTGLAGHRRLVKLSSFVQHARHCSLRNAPSPKMAIIHPNRHNPMSLWYTCRPAFSRGRGPEQNAQAALWRFGVRLRDERGDLNLWCNQGFWLRPVQAYTWILGSLILDRKPRIPRREPAEKDVSYRFVRRLEVPMRCTVLKVSKYPSPLIEQMGSEE